ncbi:substrate-binding periplasmic protein [Zooshikella harenae]|uniref:Transporter substrate-binding domain-containing protein n=1 Tax=Zooshikella harenae TaxID=2827238 RepID=A0ABS5Z8Q1_9GAMM|nr:transporter substrate-binding domain-containing protein [Zooshikella harenae]MBU2710404.1 transporter substrate-binding domain-containing protein [Zooshikella harenae]
MGRGNKVLACITKTLVVFTFAIVLRQGVVGDEPALPNSYDPNKVITVATLEDYAPFCFRQSFAKTNDISELIPPGHDSKRLQGYSWDVLRLSMHRQGYTIQLMVYPWSRVMSLVRRNEIDVVFPAAVTEKRSQFLMFSEYPVNTVHYVIYINKKSQGSWQNLAEMIGLRIGVMRGWDYGRYWNSQIEHIELREVNTVEQGFQMLGYRRIEGLVGYEEVFDHYLIEKAINKKFQKLAAFDQGFEFLSGNKLNSKAKHILKDFDSSRQFLLQQGILAELKKRWFPLQNGNF